MINYKAVESISKGYEISPHKVFHSLKTRSRRREYIKLRQLYAYIRLVCDGLSLIEVGKELGGYDHSSMINSRDRIQEQIDINSFEGRIFDLCVQIYINDSQKDYRDIAITDSITIFSTLDRLLSYEEINRAKVKNNVRKIKDIIAKLSKSNKE